MSEPDDSFRCSSYKKTLNEKLSAYRLSVSRHLPTGSFLMFHYPTAIFLLQDNLAMKGLPQTLRPRILVCLFIKIDVL